MLGASGPTSQKDWYPHPNNGRRAISVSTKSHITVRPVNVGSPNRILDRRLTLKPVTLEKAAKTMGIAVPGMPAGSPGMEMGGRVDRYDVIAFAPGGATRIFARH